CIHAGFGRSPSLFVCFTRGQAVFVPRGHFPCDSFRPSLYLSVCLGPDLCIPNWAAATRASLSVLPAPEYVALTDSIDCIRLGDSVRCDRLPRPDRGSPPNGRTEAASKQNDTTSQTQRPTQPWPCFLCMSSSHRHVMCRV
ncbi:unnamed protein product, partial [Protopolystoma xenopodis]